MVETVLINPGAASTIYQGLADDLSAIEPPTWLRMVAGWLRDRGHDVAIIDQDAMRGVAGFDWIAELRRLDPRLIVHVAAGQQPSASTQSMTGIGWNVPFVRAALPDAKQFVMGHHPSALPTETLADLPSISGVIDGEGAYTLADLTEPGRRPEHVSGLVWLDPDEQAPVKNVVPPLVDPDELGGDVWDMLPMDRYRAHNWQCLDGSPRQPYASIYTSLGCPYRCSFCMINVIQHANKYRPRSPALVVEQVRRLHDEYGVSTLKIADEMFVLKPSHYLPICEGLADLPFADELNIWAYARIDTVKPGTLALMRRAGIRWLALGIESGSAHVRDGAAKTLEESDIYAAVRAVQAAGINVVGNFMFGLPDDTHETMRATLDMALKLRCEWANFYCAMPYPGSRLYDETPAERRPLSWSGYSQHSYDCWPLPTATLTAAEVLEFRDWAFQRYFGSNAYLEMIDRKFGGQAVGEIGRMRGRELPRRLLAA